MFFIVFLAYMLLSLHSNVCHMSLTFFCFFFLFHPIHLYTTLFLSFFFRFCRFADVRIYCFDRIENKKELTWTLNWNCACTSMWHKIMYYIFFLGIGTRRDCLLFLLPVFIEFIWLPMHYFKFISRWRWINLRTDCKSINLLNFLWFMVKYIYFFKLDVSAGYFLLQTMHNNHTGDIVLIPSIPSLHVSIR